MPSGALLFFPKLSKGFKVLHLGHTFSIAKFQSNLSSLRVLLYHITGAESILVVQHKVCPSMLGSTMHFQRVVQSVPC